MFFFQQHALAALHHSGRTNIVQGAGSKPAAWTLAAAEQGHVKAQHNLGLLYEHGHGVEADMALVGDRCTCRVWMCC